ncbi:MAG TPA: hypothetical protein VGK67_40700, partial [Myxococcales bacterium]
MKATNDPTARTDLLEFGMCPRLTVRFAARFWLVLAALLSSFGLSCSGRQQEVLVAAPLELSPTPTKL